MVTVKFTYALKRFYPNLEPIEVKGTTVKEIVDGVEDKFPGLKDYVVDEQGALRKHVNIFVDGSMIADREQLSDSVEEIKEVYIMQALSGG